MQGLNLTCIECICIVVLKITLKLCALHNMFGSTLCMDGLLSIFKTGVVWN